MSTINTQGWLSFPFEAQGHQFLSKISTKSPLLKQINALPAGMFESMNRSAIAELVGSGLTREEVIQKLKFINEGASYAVVEIV